MRFTALLARTRRRIPARYLRNAARPACPHAERAHLCALEGAVACDRGWLTPVSGLSRVAYQAFGVRPAAVPREGRGLLPAEIVSPKTLPAHEHDSEASRVEEVGLIGTHRF